MVWDEMWRMYSGDVDETKTFLNTELLRQPMGINLTSSFDLISI